MSGDATRPVEPHVDAPSARWRIWIAAAVAVPVLLSLSAIWRSGARDRLIAELEAKGGGYLESHAQPVHIRAIAPILGMQDKPQYSVTLSGEQFDDAWLATTDDLAALHPNCLQLLNTRLSRESMHRLLEKHQLERLIAYDVPLTDSEMELLQDDVDLMDVHLRNTQVTDAGLRLIPMANLYALDVSGSPITGPVIQECLAGTELLSITLDGRQFTPELVKFLGTFPRLQQIGLVGTEITDEHLQLLSTMPALTGLALDETSVSPEAITAIRTAHPGWRIYVDREPIQP
jgi:hypothetical protein